MEKGAFTGAMQTRMGKFERAHRGTIFLDEVVELSPRAQAALLRMLQEGEYERVGDHQTRTVDVRLVAATNEDLEQAVKEGKFRADLYYRLNIFPVIIPPLRDRRDDIPLLIAHFLTRFENMYGKTLKGLSDKAKNFVMKYEWPGNIRELENLLERATLLTDHHQEIKLSSLFPQLEDIGNSENIVAQTKSLNDLFTEDFSLERYEQDIILSAMDKSQHNVSEAARILGISRATLDYRLKKYEVK